MGKVYLLGVKKFTSKGGRKCEVMTVRSDYNSRMLAEGCFGSKVEELFVPDGMQGLLKPEDIGKEVSIDYEVSGGRAFMIGFRVVDAAKSAEDAAKK